MKTLLPPRGNGIVTTQSQKHSWPSGPLYDHEYTGSGPYIHLISVSQKESDLIRALKLTCSLISYSTHTVNFGFEMVQAKHVSRKNIFCSINKEKIREERIFEIVHCPFEGRAKLQHLCQLNGLVGRCSLSGNWKGQCTISKILFPLLLYTFTEQNIFFPETCFAYPISEQKSRCVQLQFQVLAHVGCLFYSDQTTC